MGGERKEMNYPSFVIRHEADSDEDEPYGRRNLRGHVLRRETE